MSALQYIKKFSNDAIKLERRDKDTNKVDKYSGKRFADCHYLR